MSLTPLIPTSTCHAPLCFSVHMSPDASFLDFTTRLTTKREVSALARERGFYIVQIKGYGYVGGGYNLKIFSEPGGSDVLARNESTISGGGGPIGYRIWGGGHDFKTG